MIIRSRIYRDKSKKNMIGYRRSESSMSILLSKHFFNFSRFQFYFRLLCSVSLIRCTQSKNAVQFQKRYTSFYGEFPDGYKYFCLNLSFLTFLSHRIIEKPTKMREAHNLTSFHRFRSLENAVQNIVL